MPAAFQGYQVPMIVARNAPLAKGGLISGFGKAVLFAVPAVLVGAAVGYGLSRAFDVRWDEFSQRAVDGESTMGWPRSSGR